jgi:hypothetical protein
VDTEDAKASLADADLVPCLQAAFNEAKEVRDACLAAEIPVLLDRGDCCGQSGVGVGVGCGCAPKLQLLARAEDLPRVRDLLHDRWRELALREGTVDEDAPAVPTLGDEPPCPACGTAAPLVGGACVDCGLQLE